MTPIYIYVFNIALVLFLVFANAFFVVSEFSIVKIRRTKLEELAHQGSKRAKIALKIYLLFIMLCVSGSDQPINSWTVDVQQLKNYRNREKD